MPCPISLWASTTVTESSAPMRRNALGGGAGGPSRGSALAPVGT